MTFVSVHRQQQLLAGSASCPPGRTPAKPCTCMSQIVGKIRLALAPPVNHWWQVPLYVNARGLTTSPIPYRRQRL